MCSFSKRTAARSALTLFAVGHVFKCSISNIFMSFSVPSLICWLYVFSVTAINVFFTFVCNQQMPVFTITVWVYITFSAPLHPKLENGSFIQQEWVLAHSTGFFHTPGWKEIWQNVNECEWMWINVNQCESLQLGPNIPLTHVEIESDSSRVKWFQTLNSFRHIVRRINLYKYKLGQANQHCEKEKSNEKRRQKPTLILYLYV